MGPREQICVRNRNRGNASDCHYPSRVKKYFEPFRISLLRKRVKCAANHSEWIKNSLREWSTETKEDHHLLAAMAVDSICIDNFRADSFRLDRADLTDSLIDYFIEGDALIGWMIQRGTLKRESLNSADRPLHPMIAKEIKISGLSTTIETLARRTFARFVDNNRHRIRDELIKCAAEEFEYMQILASPPLLHITDARYVSEALDC